MIYHFLPFENQKKWFIFEPVLKTFHFWKNTFFWHHFFPTFWPFLAIFWVIFGPKMRSFLTTFKGQKSVISINVHYPKSLFFALFLKCKKNHFFSLFFYKKKWKNDVFWSKKVRFLVKKRVVGPRIQHFLMFKKWPIFF